MGTTSLPKRTGLLLLVAMLAVGVFAVLAGPAAAYPRRMNTQTATACSDCHPDGTGTPPTNAQCTACHTGFVAVTVDGVSAPAGPATTPARTCRSLRPRESCGSQGAATGCHGSAAPHPGATATGCTKCHALGSVSPTNPGTSPHHDPSATSTAVLTVALNKASIKVKTAIKASGLAYPAALGKVSIQVQKKNGTKWVKVAAKAVARTATSTWKYSYKATKKGTYRMQASTRAVTGVKARVVMSKTFKVK